MKAENVIKIISTKLDSCESKYEPLGFLIGIILLVIIAIITMWLTGSGALGVGIGCGTFLLLVIIMPIVFPHKCGIKVYIRDTTDDYSGCMAYSFQLTGDAASDAKTLNKYLLKLETYCNDKMKYRGAEKKYSKVCCESYKSVIKEAGITAEKEE